VFIKPGNSNSPVSYEDSLKDEKYSKVGIKKHKLQTDQSITRNNRTEWCFQKDGLPIKANSEWKNLENRRKTF